MKKLLAATGLAGIALFMLLGYLQADLAAGSLQTIVTLLLVVGLPAAGAVYLFREHLQGTRHRTDRREALRHGTIESEILKLAIEQHGRLTPVEVAARMALSPEDAKAALDRLALRGQAEYEVTDDGVIVYAFREILHLGGKHQAKGILDD